MEIESILKGTPAWVWLLLIFLVRRGIGALSDREMHIKRLFLLPLLFFLWGVHSIFLEVAHTYEALSGMFAGLLIGFCIGWWLWASTPRLKKGKEAYSIIRAGTPLTLVCIIATFVIKFILTARLGMYPSLHDDMAYNVFFGGVSGVLDGVFWGGTLNLFIPWYKAKGNMLS